jgi:hypothetical protein
VRSRALFVTLVVALASVGCKQRPTHRPPPQELTNVDPARTKASSSAPPPAPDIELPHGSGKPPMKTSGPISGDVLAVLAHQTWRGFQRVPHAADAAKGMEVQHVTEDHPRISATITIAPCAPTAVLGACTPMQLPAWQAREAELKKIVPDKIRAAKDTKFELGTVKFHETDLIYTFQLGQISGIAEKGPQKGAAYIAYTYAYTLYFNDGQNQIRVIAEYKDDAKPTLAETEKAYARGDLEVTAQSFFDAMTAAW